MDDAQLAAIQALGKMDNQDSGISFDVKTKKSSKFQNVHVAIPSWVFVVGAILGTATALVLIDETVKAITGFGIFPDLDGPDLPKRPKDIVAEGAKNAFDPLGLFG